MAQNGSPGKHGRVQSASLDFDDSTQVEVVEQLVHVMQIAVVSKTSEDHTL